MNSHQDLAIRALTDMKGDNTIRARAAFRGMTPKQMEEVHGYSGKTHAEILAEYEAHDRRVDQAIAWIKQAK